MIYPAGFIIKKAISFLLTPLAICFLFFIWGITALLRQRPQKAAKAFLLGAGLLYLLSLNCVADVLMFPLERQYPPFNASDPAVANKTVDWIVVLGSMHQIRPDLPPLAWLQGAALFRLTEGIRIQRSLPGSKLVLSGGGIPGPSHAEVLSEAAILLGVDPTRIFLANSPLDTHDEVMHLKERLGDDTFVLVTSAAHMPRAVKLFEHEGLTPIPAPTDYHIHGGNGFFLPWPRNIESCHSALHEYIGLLWSWMRGQLSLRKPETPS